MRFQLLAGLGAALVLALVRAPGARADPSLNAWNDLLMDQLKLNFSAFVSSVARVWCLCGGVGRIIAGSAGPWDWDGAAGTPYNGL